jgi:hypothetical protein
MGEIRNGARSYLNILNRACKLSHIPGFRAGVRRILGDTSAESVFLLWDPLCLLVESLVADDTFFNQIDFQPDHVGDEDLETEV